MKSDCTHRLTKGESSKGDIALSLSKVMADKVAEFLTKAKLESGQVVLIGGVTRNRHLVDFVRQGNPGIDFVVPAEAAYFEAEEPLVELMVEACGNLALRLARRALTVQFWNRLQAAGLGLKTPRELLAPLVRELDEAFETKNAARGFSLVHSLMRVHREQIVKELKRAQARGIR